MKASQREPTRVLENEHIKLEYLVNSARILQFSLAGRENIFAELSRKEPISTRFGEFYFRGGHRLWHAPEHMPRTYIPDNEGAEISAIPNGVRIEMPPEQWTNIVKAIEIELNPEKPQVVVRHELRNESPWAVRFAPWALTMLRQGGVGIFPQPTGNVDEDGLLPNRQLSLWPYTHIDDPRLVLRDDFILVRATPSLSPLKFGYFNPHGWIAYWLAGVLFVKRFEAKGDIEYPDYGCNVESYSNDEFIELETFGELSQVDPGQTVFHNELWELHETIDVPFIPIEIQKFIKYDN